MLLICRFTHWIQGDTTAEENNIEPNLSDFGSNGDDIPSTVGPWGYFYELEYTEEEILNKLRGVISFPTGRRTHSLLRKVVPNRLSGGQSILQLLTQSYIHSNTVIMQKS